MANNPLQFWLKFDNRRETLWFPVNPESLSISSEFGFEDVSVSKLGEISIFGERRLQSLSFSSFFPKVHNPTYCEYYNLKDPWEIVRMIERWRASRKPIRFIVTGTPINIAVTIRDFTYEPDKAGDNGDIQFSLSFKEYQFVTLRKVKFVEATSDNAPASKLMIIGDDPEPKTKADSKKTTSTSKTKTVEKTYIPKETKTRPNSNGNIVEASVYRNSTDQKQDLLVICEKHYGKPNGVLFRDVARMNSILAPYKVEPGRSIRMPAVRLTPGSYGVIL